VSWGQGKTDDRQERQHVRGANGAGRALSVDIVREANGGKRDAFMMSAWWMLWVFFMFVFLVTPTSYGWGYRKWGPPVPRYFQRRRGQLNVANGAAIGHPSWSWGGDFVWLVLLVGILWAAMGWWRR